MDRFDTLIVKKAGSPLTTSVVSLMAREAGCYAQIRTKKEDVLSLGDKVEIWHKADSETKLATVSVSLIPRSDGLYDYWATDPYREKLKKVVPSAGWRKAEVKEIAEDVLGSCGVEEYDLSFLPAVKLPHFSYKFQPGWCVLQALMDAVRSYDGTELMLMPDPDGAVVIGVRKDIAPADLPISLSEADVISMGEKCFSFHLLPMLCLQKFSFEGQSFTVKKVNHFVDARTRETEVWTC